MIILLKLWEVRNVTTFIKEWGVNEMPSGLVRPSFIFNVISKSDALNKWVVSLEVCPRWIRLLEDGKDVFDLVDCLLIKELVSNSSDKEMTISPPGISLTEKGECDNRRFHKLIL